ncbi:MAG: hypothetical protein KDA24_03900 [Deltaproteobacteria bacterium]|nr:hypothetical protein [Deltaproteobacteria bacterium]
MVLLGVVLVVLNALGAFHSADAWLLGRLAGLRPNPERTNAPLILAIDQRAEALLGPLPWSVTQWEGVAASLAASGVDEAFLVDPWARVLRRAPEHDSSADREGAQAVIRVPRAISVVGDSRVLGEEVPAVGPFVPWDHSLYLPRGDDGVLRDLREVDLPAEAGPSAFCVWAGRCPGGGPLGLAIAHADEASELPAISLARVLEGHARVAAALEGGRIALLGVHTVPMGEPVLVGPDRTRLWRSQAVSLAVTTVHPSTPARTLPVEAESALIFLILGAVFALGYLDRLARPGAAAAGVAALSSLLVGGLWIPGIAVPPAFALLALPLAPPLVLASRSRALAVTLFRRIALMLVTDDYRSGWRDTRLLDRVRTFQELAALSRLYTHSGHMAYVQVDAGGKLGWVGGFGVERDDLVLDLKELRRAAHNEEDLQSAKLLGGDTRRGFALPIRRFETLVGFWIIVLDDGDPPLSLARLQGFARWVSGRQDPRTKDGFRTLRERMRGQLVLEASEVERIYEAATLARRRQDELFQSVSRPMFTSNVTGQVKFLNRAAAQWLEQEGLEEPTSVRHLAYQLLGDRPDFDDLGRKLFLEGESIALDWTADRRDARTWRVVFEPVRGADGLEVVGFSATVDDTEVLPGTRSLVGIPAIPVDMGELVRTWVSKLDAQAQARAVVLDLAVARSPLPVMAPPQASRAALTRLLDEAVDTAQEGSTVSIQVLPEGPRCRVQVDWAGAGIERELARALTSPTGNTMTFPSHLRALRRVREAFTDVVVTSAPGEGVHVVVGIPLVSMPRARSSESGSPA